VGCGEGRVSVEGYIVWGKKREDYKYKRDEKREVRECGKEEGPKSPLLTSAMSNPCFKLELTMQRLINNP
jgi:hypothetical protein